MKCLLAKGRDFFALSSIFFRKIGNKLQPKNFAAARVKKFLVGGEITMILSSSVK